MAKSVSCTNNIINEEKSSDLVEMLEITVAVLAAFGVYSILEMVRFSLLFPRRIRKNVRAAVVFDENSYRETVAYVNYLRREQKISPERLIIIKNNGIIESDGSTVLDMSVHKEDCKDSSDDAGYDEG